MQLPLLLETPYSNTGVESHFDKPVPFCPDTPILAIDHVTLLWYEREDFDILPFVREILGVEFDFTVSFPMRVGVVWENCYRGSLGCLYMFRRTETGIRYRLSVSGRACSSVPLELLLRFFEIVHSNNPEVECKRLDICLDDYSKRLTFENLCAALDAENYSGFRNGLAIKNFDKSGGWTVELGSRQSDHFVRAYNKSAQSKGRIDAVRWESEFKGDKANYIYHQLASQKTVVDSMACLELYVFGDFNFIHKDDKNLERCDKLDWWAEFLDWVGFGRAKVLIEKPVTSIESRIIWIKKQVEKSLALLSRAFGLDDFDSFIDDCVASGSRRLKRFDDILLLEYLNARLVA